MLAMLGGFYFEVNKNGFQDFNEKLKLTYAKHRKAQNFIQHEAIGKYEECFSMKGTLILQDIHSLDSLKDLAKTKVPVLLVLGSGFAYWVIIDAIEVESSRFLVGGAALKRKFTVNLERYYYEQSIFSSFFSAIG